MGVALNQVRDGGPLRVLETGLIVVRRRKHEYDPRLATLTAEQLRERTNKIFGSKFSPEWTLEDLTDWIVHQVTELGWTLQPGTRRTHDVHFSRDVGLVAGATVRTIRLVSDGKHVHAYPVRRES